MLLVISIRIYSMIFSIAWENTYKLPIRNLLKSKVLNYFSSLELVCTRKVDKLRKLHAKAIYSYSEGVSNRKISRRIMKRKTFLRQFLGRILQMPLLYLCLNNSLKMGSVGFLCDSEFFFDDAAFKNWFHSFLDLFDLKVFQNISNDFSNIKKETRES